MFCFQLQLAPLQHGRVIWRGIINPADIKYPSSATDGIAAAKSAQGEFPEFCPVSHTAVVASNDSSVGRVACFMDVGGGDIYWAAG